MKNIIKILTINAITATIANAPRGTNTYANKCEELSVVVFILATVVDNKANVVLTFCVELSILKKGEEIGFDVH